MRAIDCHPPWTARLRCISLCWTAGRKTETTDPSLSRLSAFWTSSYGTQAAWRSSPVQQQGDALACIMHSLKRMYFLFPIVKFYLLFLHLHSLIVIFLKIEETYIFFSFLIGQEEISCNLMIKMKFSVILNFYLD